MLATDTFKDNDIFTNPPRQFSLSEQANQLIEKNTLSWQENITQLIQRNYYADAALLITLKLPLSSAIEWSDWSIKTHSNDSNDSQDASSPKVWRSAAEFWNKQYEESEDIYLHDIAKEAICSSIALVAQQPENDSGVYRQILTKGIELIPV